MEKKLMCEYGVGCYRKNPEHLKKYSHLPEKNDPKEKVPLKKRKAEHSPKKVLKQTKLDFFRQAKPLDVRREAFNTRLRRKETDEGKAANAVDKESRSEKELRSRSPASPPERRGTLSPSKKSPKRKGTPSPTKKATIIEESSENESDDDESGVCDVTSNSWTFKKNSASKDECSESLSSINTTREPEAEAECKTPAETIKHLFLVDMPDDFYSFFEFCETLNGKNPKQALQQYGLRLVGPFDVLTGELSQGKITAEQALCHWRFYMDPPEMQTAMVGEKGLHYGYWRDDPSTKETFVVSNTVPSCTIHPVAANLFGAAVTHMTCYIRHCTPFEKVKANKVLSSLKQWAEDREMGLSDCSEILQHRKKKVVAPTFHGLGIVVPVQPGTEIGYRPLLETNANLKKLCQSIIKAKSPAEAESKMEDLERLVNAANIANDECDFGNALELGIDLFCMGSDVFHDFVEHLLVTAYTLLDRPEWAKIVKSHLKNRRTGLQLSAVRQNRR